MDFVKVEGLGNDFVVVEDVVPTRQQITRWCHRRSGIGADGVLSISRPAGSEAAIRMQYWNADGSPASMCGNGLRCVARYAYERGYTNGRAFVVQTAVGLNRAEVGDDGLIRVELGPYDVGDDVEIGGHTYATATVGNHHAVRWVDEPDDAPVEIAGAAVSVDPAFPDGANVEFISHAGTGLRMRVWERGVGETMACGSGAAAAAAVAHEAGRVGPQTTVELRGGQLGVELNDGVAWLVGPANEVFTGQLPDPG